MDEEPAKRTRNGNSERKRKSANDTRHSAYGLLDERERMKAELIAAGVRKDIAGTKAFKWAERRVKEMMAYVEPPAGPTDAETRLAHLRGLLAAVPATRTQRRQEANDWVGTQVYSTDLLGVEQIPSRGALTLLVWCLESAENLKDFMLRIWQKGAETEGDRRFSDDGRQQFALIDRALAAHREAVSRVDSEGLPGEPVLAAGDS